MFKPYSMIHIQRVDSNHADFLHLVKLLDADLAIRDGEDHTFYAAFNKVDSIKHAIVGYQNGQPASCGAFKHFNKESVEIKRMFVKPAYRGKGVAKLVLTQLENWAWELGYKKCVLETGQKQPEAIQLYTGSGYYIIPNYGQYAGVENSVCMEKILH